MALRVAGLPLRLTGWCQGKLTSSTGNLPRKCRDITEIFLKSAWNTKQWNCLSVCLSITGLRVLATDTCLNIFSPKGASAHYYSPWCVFVSFVELIFSHLQQDCIRWLWKHLGEEKDCGLSINGSTWLYNHWIKIKTLWQIMSATGKRLKLLDVIKKIVLCFQLSVKLFFQKTDDFCHLCRRCLLKQYWKNPFYETFLNQINSIWQNIV